MLQWEDEGAGRVEEERDQLEEPCAPYGEALFAADWNRADQFEGKIRAALCAAHFGAIRRASTTGAESTSRAGVLEEEEPGRMEAWPQCGAVARG